MYVFGEGKIASRISVKEGVATFTLRLNNDRFFVTTTGLEQLRTVLALKPGDKIVVLGTLYSFRGRGCGQHHVGVEPQILLPVNGLTGDQAEMVRLVVRQWAGNVLSPILESMKNGRVVIDPISALEQRGK